MPNLKKCCEMEAEHTASKKTTIDQFLQLYNDLSDMKSSLQSHEFLSNGQTESLNANSVMEVKYLKKLFISMSSYSTFLDNIVKPRDEWVNEKQIDVSATESFVHLEEPEIEYQSTKEKQVFVQEKFKEYGTFLKNAASYVEIAQEIELKKKQCDEVLAKKNTQLKVFPEGCKNHEDVAMLIQKKEKEIAMLQDELFLKIPSEKECYNQRAALNKLFRLLIEFENRANSCKGDDNLCNDLPADQSSSEKLCKPLGGIQVIDSQPDFDIVEVHYTNSKSKESSVVVKIIFSCDSDNDKADIRIIESILIGNSPIKAEDLIQTAIANNNIAIVLPELQRRLSKT